MATGEALFSLIQTLSKGEKSSFTRNNKPQKKDNNYNEVFIVLSKIGEYDKEEILARLQGTMTKKKLQDAETYLYKKIIATLKASYSQSSIDIQLHDLILEAQILYRKGLNELAIKIFAKAEKKAKEHHKNALLLEIAPQKAAAIVALNKINVQEDIDLTYEMAHNAVINLKQEMYYRHENIKLVTGFRTKPNDTEYAIECYQKIQKNGFPTEGTFFSKYYYYNILALSSRLQKNYENAIKYQAKAVDIWDEHFNIIKKNIAAYITQLANQINYLICAKKYDEAEVVIKKMEDLEASNLDEKGEQFQNVYFQKQRLYLNQKNYTASKNLVKEIKEGLTLYAEKINISRELTFLYTIGLTFWLMRDYVEALTWFEKIPNSNRFNEHRPDVVRVVHLLQLAIFYEINSGNVVELIDNKLRSVKRKEISPFEEILIQFFRELNDCLRSSKKEQVIFTNFKIALNQLEGQQITGYEAYCDWVSYRCGIKLG
jgi:tetratricopeptide (TPR) repeat protein